MRVLVRESLLASTRAGIPSREVSSEELSPQSCSMAVPEDMAGHSKCSGTRRRRILYIASSIALPAIICLCAVWAWHHYREISGVIECTNQLRAYYGHLLEQNDEPFQTSDAYSLTQSREDVACSCSDQPFEYIPFEVLMRRDDARRTGRELSRMIAWCPAACHSGKRVVLFEDGVVSTLRERAFQDAVADDLMYEHRGMAE